MKCVKLMKAAWTDPKFLPDEFSVEVWYEALKDLPGDRLALAVRSHMSDCKWPPSIAELRKRAILPSDGEDWSAAWEKVIRAIGRFGYTNESEALESFDETTREVVKRLNWKQICMTDTDNLQTLRANFRMIYEQIQEKTEQNAVLPVSVREQLSGLAMIEGTSDEVLF